MEAFFALRGRLACCRCIFLKPAQLNALPTCSQAGVLASNCAILGTIQAAEALKYTLGSGGLLTEALRTFGGPNMDFHKIRLRKQKYWQICGENQTITELHARNKG